MLPFFKLATDQKNLSLFISTSHREFASSQVLFYYTGAGNIVCEYYCLNK